ncbi:MAG TPA: MFS transporter, partial [Acidimicrobiia bacterium]|nr:MFS transporter [Acidimicrobiia bacterium]
REESDPAATIAESLTLLRDDISFRRFVVARTLMLATALSPPLIVSMSAEASEAGVSGLGPFVVATGLAGLASSPIWGRLADRSSRLVMAIASGSAGVVILAFLGGWIAEVDAGSWLGPTAYLLLAIVHAGARMGRKTYVIDLGSGDARTRYVAVSNTVIGARLLFTGVVSAVVAEMGTELVLAGFAVLGLVGSMAALRMEEIH